MFEVLIKAGTGVVQESAHKELVLRRDHGVSPLQPEQGEHDMTGL